MQSATLFACFWFWDLAFFSFFFSFCFLVFADAQLCLAALLKASEPQLPVPPFGGDEALQQGQGTGCRSMPQPSPTTLV